MKHFLYIAAFALAASLFYTAVGTFAMPQIESRPPREVVWGSGLSTDELVEAGAGVFDASCVQCHKIGRTDRCPDMAGMGQRAKDRASAHAPVGGKPVDDVDYLLEAVCKPGEFLVEGYANIMPPQGKTLTGPQIIAVVAFLQDQGSNVTVSLEDEHKADLQQRLHAFGCGDGAGSPGAVVAAAEPVGPPDQVFTTFNCGACHALDKPDRGLGPSLQGVGQRLDKGELYEAILTPDVTLAAGDPPYPAGLMKGTLDGLGFYQRMTPADYKALVDWLAEHGK